MFLQEGGGLFGIGAPEIATIAVVGYFVLGPEDLYKVTKEIGKFITNIRSVAMETSANFENTMESQLQIKELQKAGRELNDAFSFRRSINYDEDVMAPPVDLSEEKPKPVSEETMTEGSSVVKKRKKRRKKKKAVPPPVNDIPESLEMPQIDGLEETSSTSPADWFSKEELTSAFDDSAVSQSREDRKARLQGSTPSDSSMDSLVSNWESDDELGFMSASNEASAEEAAEKSRFAAQMSADWNQSILDNQEQLEPLGKVMERLAILEEERAAAERRLEEEFRLRTELEEKYYKEKKKVLEEAAVEVQSSIYEEISDNAVNSTIGISSANIESENEKISTMPTVPPSGDFLKKISES